MGAFQRAAAATFYFLWAVALAVLYSSVARLQPAPPPPSPPLLNRLLGVHFHPIARVWAFLLTNALVLAFLLRPRHGDQAPLPAPLPHDARVGEAHPDDSLPVPHQEEDVSDEDEAVYGTGSSLTASHAPTAATWGAPRGRLSRLSAREGLARDETWEGPSAPGQYRRSDPDVGTLWQTPLEEEDESGVVEENEAVEENESEVVEGDEAVEEEDEEEIAGEVRDELWERAEEFIGRQVRFMRSEEVMLAMVAAGGP